jgi:hypothetical protein
MESSAINWSNYFAASSSAAATLAGLVFVALSINLKQILELPTVSGRAAETIILLAASLGVSLAALIPGLTMQHLGLVLLAITLPTWVVPVIIQLRVLGKNDYPGARTHSLIRAFLHQFAALPGVVGACALYFQVAAGNLWLAAGITISMLVALLNAWVLLVEILR